MAFIIGIQPRRGLRLAVAGAVVFTSLTAATAAASAPTPMEVQAVGVVRLVAGDPGSGPSAGAGLRARSGGSTTRSGDPTSPRSQFPGFVLDRGRYTSFESPDPGVDLFPLGINDRGQIAGEYIRVGPDGIPDSESGFVRDRRGRITVLDVPGATGTETTGVNNRGHVVGAFSEDTPIVNDSASPHAYLLDRGRVTRIDVPDAVGTGANGINDRAQVVGGYDDAGGRTHGFLWDRGRFTTIDAPGAVTTVAIGINNRGQVVGQFVDAGGKLHGFLWQRGRFTTIDAPGAPLTTANGINDRGQIVGSTLAPTQDDPLAGARGFLLAKGVKGPFTPIEVPGAPRTLVFGLNNHRALVGVYENTAATPSPPPAGAPPLGRMG